jgi:hypothetical protein
MLCALLNKADSHVGVGGHVAFYGGYGAVRAAVVHDHNVFGDASNQHHIPHLVQDQMDGALLVVSGNNDGQLRYHGAKIAQ